MNEVPQETEKGWANMFKMSAFPNTPHLSLSMLTRYSVLFFIVGISGCASVPGKTGAEQAQTINELVDRTLSDLYKQEPNTEQEVANSVGYAIMNNKITKIPLVGAGGGYGVAINNKTGQKTYLKMARFDVGGGWGARSVRPVAIFQDEKKFNDFIE